MSLRWNKLAVSYQDNVMIKLMNDSTNYYSVKVDSIKKKIIMNTYADTLHKYPCWPMSSPQKDILSIKGIYNRDSLFIKLQKLDPNKFLLVRRGFHWINEYPYNR